VFKDGGKVVLVNHTSISLQETVKKWSPFTRNNMIVYKSVFSRMESKIR